MNVRIESPYFTYSIVTHKTRWAEDAIAGVFVAPGRWMNAYIEHENYFLAETSRRTFQFHPHQHQHELRLALYLTERWRQLARDGNFAKEISMSELLAASMIPVDRAHLTSQFVPRIEHALREKPTPIGRRTHAHRERNPRQSRENSCSNPLQ